jgi:glycolate oxidase FAD binding subunit
MSTDVALAALERELGGEILRSDPAALRPFAIGGKAPRAAAFPGTPEQLALVLARANEAGWGVVPWGGGSRIQLGPAPTRYDLALGSARLASILEHDADNLTLTAQAGATLLAANLRIKAQRQTLAAGWPWERHTLGGMLAANRAVPKRLAYGGLRDQVLGLRVALPDGKLLRYGGKVLKNVAGYDLTKLFIGSLGTGGVIVESTWKLFAHADEEQSLLLAFPAFERAAALAAKLLRSPLLPAYLYLLDARAAGKIPEREKLGIPPGHALAWVGFDGRGAAVRRQLKDTEALAGPERGQAIGTPERPSEAAASFLMGEAPLEPDQARVRIGCAPSRVGAVHALAGQGLDRLGVPAQAVADYPAGRVYWTMPCGGKEAVAELASWILSLRASLRGEGAFVVVEGAPGELTERTGVWGDLGGAGKLMVRLQREFDPKGILSPGRLISA